MRHALMALTLFATLVLVGCGNNWEKKNKAEIVRLSNEVKELNEAGETEKAKAKYAELNTLVGDRKLKDEKTLAAFNEARKIAAAIDKAASGTGSGAGHEDKSLVKRMTTLHSDSKAHLKTYVAFSEAIDLESFQAFKKEYQSLGKVYLDLKARFEKADADLKTVNNDPGYTEENRRAVTDSYLNTDRIIKQSTFLLKKIDAIAREWQQYVEESKEEDPLLPPTMRLKSRDKHLKSFKDEIDQVKQSGLLD